MNPVEHLTLMLVAFSVPCLLALLVAYLFFLDGMRKTWISRLACTGLLLGLVGLQFEHYRWLMTGVELLQAPSYLLLLLVVPVAFYFASRAVLLADAGWHPAHLLHLAPVGPIWWFAPASWVPPLAFLIGTGYTLRFVQVVLTLRPHSARFRFERFFFLLFALLALLALALGLVIPWIDPAWFLLAYANILGGSVFLVLTALVSFPELLRDIAEVAERSYARSRLEGVDVTALAARLEQLMAQDALYENEDLDLEATAAGLNITPQQLSELVNRHFGVGFPRYLRQQRVAAAQRLLRAEPAASVLAIGLQTGFRSQSSFYAAFREVTGTSPGQFRRRARSE